MEMYLVKSAACLAVLLLFYKLLLEKENMHIFKRFYLLVAALAAITIPLITFTTYAEPSSENLNSLIISSEVLPQAAVENLDYWPYIFFGIYLLGVLFFIIKFFRNLRSLILKIRTNPKLRSNSFINVLLSEKIQPHTFFSFIFFNKEKYLQDEIPQDVKIHEEAHARQKHSLDVLLVELLQIIFWFNPLIFLLKDAVKLNHEFLADREVIRRGKNISRYQQTLLAYSSQDLQCDLVNPINYSSIKKRFTVMKTKTSKKTIWARSLLLIPLIAGLIHSCSSKEIVQLGPTASTYVQDQNFLEFDVDENGSIFLNSTNISISELQEIEKGKYTEASIIVSTKTPQATIDELVEVIRLKGVRTISICSPGDRNFMNSGAQTNDQEKVTPEMLAEYNNLVKHYNSVPKDELKVKQENINRIMAILGRMTPEQKEKAEKITFDVPPPPPPAPRTKDDPATPPPPPPSPIEAIKEWIEEGAEFFYNGKKVTNKEALGIVQEKNGKNLGVQVQENTSGKTIRISDKESSKQDPPAPDSYSKKTGVSMTRAETIEHLGQLAKDGVVFTYLDKEISLKETIDHLQNRRITIRYSEEGSRGIIRVEDI